MRTNDARDLEGMTDEELDSIVDVLTENRPEEANLLAQIAETVEPSDSIEESSTQVALDVNGDPIPLTVMESMPGINSDLDIAQVEEGELEKSNQTLFGRAVGNTAKTIDMDISDEEVHKLIKVLARYKAGDKFNPYLEMPKSLVTAVDNLFREMGGQVSKKTISIQVLENFLAEANLEKEFIDFQKTMETTLDIPSIIDMYSEHIKDVMETKTLEMADKFEAEYPEKSALLRRVSAAFTSSYTYDKMLECLATNKKAYNHITKDNAKYKKFCNDFNYKNKDSKFLINDIFMVGETLQRVLPDVPSEDITKFVILLCKTCADMNSNDVVDCSFMYYTIKNIIMLDFAAETKTDFSINLIENIKAVIEKLNTVEKKHKEEIENAYVCKKSGKKNNRS